MTSQKTILERIVAGDQAAVQEHIDAYGNLVWSLARRFLRNDADAEDAVQDAFIELRSSAGRFDRNVASEIAYVSTIVRRRLIARRRQQQRHPDMHASDAADAGERHQPAVAAPAGEESDVAAVARVLADMQPQHREILRLSLYEGYSHSEIAARLDLPSGTVKTRVRHGLIHICSQLGIDAGPGDEAAR